MEKGQSLSFPIPKGFTETDEKTLNKITRDLFSIFQYRKFAYENFLKYI